MTQSHRATATYSGLLLQEDHPRHFSVTVMALTLRTPPTPSTSELLHYAVLKHKQRGRAPWSRSAAVPCTCVSGQGRQQAPEHGSKSAAGRRVQTLSPAAPTSLSKASGSRSKSWICPFLPVAARRGPSRAARAGRGQAPAPRGQTCPCLWLLGFLPERKGPKMLPTFLSSWERRGPGWKPAGAALPRTGVERPEGRLS